MKIYVAGSVHDIREVRAVQGFCRSRGHTITYDWTANVEAEGGPAVEGLSDPRDIARYAANDKMGVVTADVVIAVDHPELYGTLMELGMAMGRDKQVWLYGPWERFSVFFSLPNVKRVKYLGTELARASS